MAKSSFVANPAKIKVIGLGGGGSNAITRMVREDIQGVEFIAMNTDAQALAVTEAPVRIQLGEKLTRGLGVGVEVGVGKRVEVADRGTAVDVCIGLMVWTGVPVDTGATVGGAIVPGVGVTAAPRLRKDQALIANPSKHKNSPARPAIPSPIKLRRGAAEGLAVAGPTAASTATGKAGATPEAITGAACTPRFTEPPTPTVSPGRSHVETAMRWWLTKVPLDEPRSSIHAPSGCTTIRA